MQNLVALWVGLTLRRRVVLVASTVAVFLAVLGLGRMAANPGMALLYAGLDEKTAGEVIAALGQEGVQYEVQGDSIRVPSDQRDSLRMVLAGQGLPATGGVGYELLDGLSGFSTTSQMFDAAFWRAREGELARTILGNPAIRSARVHIAQAPAQPFKSTTSPTASVTVATGAPLTAMQAKAIRHLVAAAVVGMTPDKVDVIDTSTGLIAQDAETGVMGQDADKRAAEIKANVERLLSARVGQGKALVEVTVDLVTESEQITERTFDPQGRVAISTDTEERSGTNQSPGGSVTVASNLPEGDGASGGGAQSQSSETRERVNFEVSETQREVLRAPGSVKRLSVAVLVDGELQVAADGTETWVARSDEEMGVLRELVASAVGLDEARGDVLTLKSLQFQTATAGGTLVEAGFLPRFGPIDLMSVIQIAALSIVSLILGLFVLRPLLAAAPVLPALPPPGPQATLALANGSSAVAGGLPVLTGEVSYPNGEAVGPLANGSLGAAGGARGEDPVIRLRRLIEQRQAESVEVLRGWMEREEELR